MEILDLRPGVIRRFNRNWDGVPGKTSALRVDTSGAVSRLVGAVTDAVVSRRVRLRPAPSALPKLVSVGNLAVGGTGKTPVVMALARALASLGRTGAVLTRGFGSGLKGPLRVTRDNTLAGDEARLMAWQLAALDWPVVQARRRPAGLSFINQEFPHLDYVLLEDAHQTSGLPRHLDVLILDSWEMAGVGSNQVLVPRTGPVFPFGAWRESARGAERAGILLVETGQAVPSLGDREQSVASFQRNFNLSDPQGHVVPGLVDTPYALLSGIARPAAFERAVSREIGAPAALSIRCRDHVSYGPRLMRRVETALQKANTEILLTTCKDWVKLETQIPAGLKVILVELAVSWGQTNALPQLVEERLDLPG